MGVVKTFLLPSYGFSFGYKRKGVSFAPLTEAQSNIVGHKYALSKATVMRTKILSVTPVNPLGVTAPLMNKGSQENGVDAVTGRGYNPSVSFADSSPSIRSEAPSFIVARAAKPLVFGAKHQTQNVVRQSRTNILPKIHRGTEICAPFSSASTGKPRFALRLARR